MESWVVRLRAQETAEAAERALAHLERAGERGARLRGTVRSRLAAATTTARCRSTRRSSASRRSGQATTASSRQHGRASTAGRLHAMKGDVDRARELWSDARQVYVDAGLLMSAASFAQGGAEIAFRAGDLRREETLLRDSLEILEANRRAGVLLHQRSLPCRMPLPRGSGRCRDRGVVREGARGDPRRGPHQLRLARDGRRAARRAPRGVRAGRGALASSGRSGRNDDFHRTRSSAHAYLAEVLALSGRSGEAAEAAAEAFGIFAAKGDVTAAAQFRARLSSFGVAVD